MEVSTYTYRYGPKEQKIGFFVSLAMQTDRNLRTWWSGSAIVRYLPIQLFGRPGYLSPKSIAGVSELSRRVQVSNIANID